MDVSFSAAPRLAPTQVVIDAPPEGCVMSPDKPGCPQATDVAFLLDVVTPYQEHVLPMIPGGMTVRDIIKA